MRSGSHPAFWRNKIVMTDPDRQRLGVLDPATGKVRELDVPSTTRLG